MVVLGGSVSETELAGSILHYNDTSNSWQAVPTTGWTPRFGMAATVLDVRMRAGTATSWRAA